MNEPQAGRVVQADGRSKAYRPLPAIERETAVRAGLEAYERGDYFLAHEVMEPAWMGTADPAERALVQGLIKLAAADVHGVRGNPRGVARNLEGAIARLRLARDADVTTADPHRLDLAKLVTALEGRLEQARTGATTAPVPLPRSG